MFEDVYRDMIPKLQKWSWSQRIPGMTRSEMLSEMVQTLWRAYESFNGTGDFQKYAAGCWYRRKVSLLREAMAKKRAVVDLYADVPDVFIEFVNLVPECPVDDPLAKKVWTMIAQGFKRNEIERECEITWRGWDAVLALFRTDDVRVALLR